MEPEFLLYIFYKQEVPMELKMDCDKAMNDSIGVACL
jgi:hypothetical protein